MYYDKLVTIYRKLLKSKEGKGNPYSLCTGTSETKYRWSVGINPNQYSGFVKDLNLL